MQNFPSNITLYKKINNDVLFWQAHIQTDYSILIRDGKIGELITPIFKSFDDCDLTRNYYDEIVALKKSEYDYIPDSYYFLWYAVDCTGKRENLSGDELIDFDYNVFVAAEIAVCWTGNGIWDEFEKEPKKPKKFKSKSMLTYLIAVYNIERAIFSLKILLNDLGFSEDKIYFNVLKAELINKKT